MLNKREKKSIYDNAQLMATWNWKKNEEVGFDPHKLTPIVARKHGGYAHMVTNGKQRLIAALKGMGALIAAACTP